MFMMSDYLQCYLRNSKEDSSKAPIALKHKRVYLLLFTFECFPSMSVSALWKSFIVPLKTDGWLKYVF